MNIFQFNCQRLIEEVKYLQRGNVSPEDKKLLQGLIEDLQAASVTNDAREYLNIKSIIHPPRESKLKKLMKKLVKVKTEERKVSLTRKRYSRVNKVIELDKFRDFRGKDMHGYRYGEYIVNSIQYIADLEHLKSYAQNTGELEALSDKQLYTKYLVNEMCKYEGWGKIYDLPKNETWERIARVEVKNGLEYEPKKQRELQV